jgi:hypothetical protein
VTLNMNRDVETVWYSGNANTTRRQVKLVASQVFGTGPIGAEIGREV